MLKDEVIEYNRRIRDALRTIYDALNAGQRKKILKDKTVAELFERYKVLEENAE